MYIYVASIIIAVRHGTKVIKLFSCSAQLRLEFILPINVKMHKLDKLQALVI